ncbi:hypothetical protein [Xenorhabdus vietnamensis]|nr:hypothetical protein [Xenorhabdus vietnamensis]
MKRPRARGTIIEHSGKMACWPVRLTAGVGDYSRLAEIKGADRL